MSSLTKNVNLSFNEEVNVVDDFDDGLDGISSRLNATTLSLQFSHDDSCDSQISDAKSTSSSSAQSTSSTTQKKVKSVSWNDQQNVVCISPVNMAARKSGYRVTSEIISAKAVTRIGQKGRKFVSYTILVKRVPGLETQPALIERRYSDFLVLYKSLRKIFPDLLNDFPFPKKTLVGNFTPEIITERSVAFHHLLTFCISISELRLTQEFADFLFLKESREASRLMKVAKFDEASSVIENIYFIQEKLYFEPNHPSFRSLCVLIAALDAVDNVSETATYVERAIEMISLTDAYDNSELIVPLISLTVRLWARLSKDPSPLERKLRELSQNNNLNIVKQPTLLELVLRQDFLTCRL